MIKLDFGMKLKDPEGGIWAVVGFDSYWVMFSGPLPCRGTKHAARKDLTEWTILPDLKKST
jgi:hypothetical protein